MDLPEWSNSVSKNVLKLADGESVVGVFRGSISRFYQHWVNNRSVRCPGRDTCANCQSENEKTRYAVGRFRMNFVTKRDKNDPFRAFVFENGKKVYEQLISINKDCPLERTKVRITRSGKGTQTQIIIQVLAGEGGIVKADLEKELAAVPLHPLEETAPAVADGEPVVEHEEAPF